MLFTTFTLATLALVSAAPLTSRAPAQCKSDYTPDGKYIDSGCGTLINPDQGATPRLRPCVVSDQEVKEGNPIYLGACVSSEKWGGRWELEEGSSKIRLMQARTNEFCMVPNEDRTGVKVSKCDDASSPWNIEGARIRLADTDRCLAVTGDLRQDPKSLALLNPESTKVSLAPCSDDISQVFFVNGITPPPASSSTSPSATSSAPSSDPSSTPPPAPSSATESASVSAASSATESATDTAASSATESTTEPAPSSAPSPTAEPATESATESATETVAESVTPAPPACPPAPSASTPVLTTIVAL